MLHHLVNLTTVCTTQFDCITKMAKPVNQIVFKLNPGLTIKARPVLKQEVVAHVHPVS